MSTSEDQLEQLFQQVGVDVDLNPETEVEIDNELDTSSLDQVELETTQVTVYETYDPSNPEAKTKNIQKDLLMESGDQISIIIYRRPECPSCGYVPTEEGEPGHLTGKCVICDTSTCPRCKNTCEACGTILCPECSEGHGLEDTTYCPKHREDIEEDIRFQRREKEEERKHKQKKEVIEQRRKIEKQREELRQQREDKKLERQLKSQEFKLKLAQALHKVKDEEQKRLEERKSSNHVKSIKSQGRRLRDS